MNEKEEKQELKMKLKKKQNSEVEWEIVYSPLHRDSVSRELPKKEWKTKLELKSVVNKIGDSINNSSFVKYDPTVVSGNSILKSKIREDDKNPTYLSFFKLIKKRNGYIKLDTIDELED